MRNSHRSEPLSRHPLKSILKKASKVLKCDLAAARFPEISPFTLPASGPDFYPTETIFRARNSQSPPRPVPSLREKPNSPIPTDTSLTEKLEEAMKTIQAEREALRVKQLENRHRRLVEVLAQLEDKTVLTAKLEDGGSETEHGSYANNRLAMKLAVRQYVTDIQQREELLHLIDTSGTPRLSILMHRQKVEGLYRQSPSGFVKVYGSAQAPETVKPGMVKKCFEFKAETLAQVSQKQMWKADAFSL